MNFKSEDGTNVPLHAKSSMISSFDGNKYLELLSFNAFHKNYVKDMEFLKHLVDENRLVIDEVNDKLKFKVSDSDLKSLDEYLTAKIDEVKFSLLKRFADKIDTNKSIKYLETQIKHVIDVYVKKVEKGENWMLAKKPIGGYSCASCENYLGDLTEKANDNTPWSKHQTRDLNDNKTIKVGNGFSRMVQMMNVDLKKLNNEEKVNVVAVLPKIGKEKEKEKEKGKGKEKEKENSFEFYKDEDETRPRIVNIYKKKAY